MKYLLIPCMLVMLTIPASARPFMSAEEVPRADGYRTNVLLTNLDHPWSMAWLPDGGMLITERRGRVLLYKDGLVSVVPGAPEVLRDGQGGLLDISLHPDFATNKLVYFTIATGSDDANHTALVRASYDGARLSGVRQLFSVSQLKSGGQHFGSRLAWLPDKTLLMTVGDGGNPPLRINGELSRKMAQNPRMHLGKILRLNDDGSPVGSGEFTADGGLPELYTMGHRNIQGLAYDPLRGTVWASEHGARGGDEINRIRAGGNYGWPEASYSKEYTLPMNVADAVSLPGMVDPVVVWLWRFAPSGLCLYSGDAFPQWKGSLLAGGLRSRTIRLIHLDAEGDVTGERRIDMDQRVRDVRQGPDGLVYILTDEADGQLIRLEPDS